MRISVATACERCVLILSIQGREVVCCMGEGMFGKPVDNLLVHAFNSNAIKTNMMGRRRVMPMLRKAINCGKRKVGKWR